MNKPPTGPEFEPEDVDRLISRFNRSADPEKRQELDDALKSEKERFAQTRTEGRAIISPEGRER